MQKLCSPNGTCRAPPHANQKKLGLDLSDHNLGTGITRSNTEQGPTRSAPALLGEPGIVHHFSDNKPAAMAYDEAVNQFMELVLVGRDNATITSMRTSIMNVKATAIVR